MTVRTVYCSACDRNVTVMAGAKGGLQGEGTEVDSSAGVCLDYGEKCTGEMCPILAQPSAQVRENLARLRRQS